MAFQLVLMVVVLGGMWFFMSRSQKKQQQQRQNLLDSMKTGDAIVTIGGLHGIISEVNVEDKTIVIDCEGIYLEFDRAAIKTVTANTVKNDEVEVAAEEKSISSEDEEID